MAGLDPDDELDEDEVVDESSPPWHNSTRAVVGASALGIAVIGILVAAVMYVTRQDDSPSAPVEFIDPSFSATASESPTSATTTETITSTVRLSTTEINEPPTSPTSSDTTTSSSTSSSTSTTSGTPPPPPIIRTHEENPGGPTSRRPRFNVTRTLQPQPIG